MSLSTMPSRRVSSILLATSVFVLFIVFLRLGVADKSVTQQQTWIPAIKEGAAALVSPSDPSPPAQPNKPKYKPAPTYTPPPIEDPFPLLSTQKDPPPIPAWNRPRKNLHRDYDLPVAPPLFIGFTRTWPILLQAVVSYITAGWPPSQIYVVENTGVHQANTHGQLTLQNPFYLNHTQLRALGVNIIQTPVLLNFPQLQNFFLNTALTNDWPYYFWSHQDVLALSFEAGLDDVTPPYTSPDYKTVYELCCAALASARADDPHWATRFFAYDHLALVNPAAYVDVGGWDTLIPYYLSDCDMHSRLLMANWSMLDAPAGTITDTSAALQDLRALYRDNAVEPDFVDPNPPPPSNSKRDSKEEMEKATDPHLAYYWALRFVSDRMFWYKHGDRGRNTWQAGQQGGQGEAFYYPAAGLAEGMEVLTEAGREVYRRKWGHRDCDLISGAGLGIADQWRVEKDWTD